VKHISEEHILSSPKEPYGSTDIYRPQMKTEGFFLVEILLNTCGLAF